MLQASLIRALTSISSTGKGWNEAVTQYLNRLEPQDMA